MASRRISNLINRNNQGYDDAFSNLKFSSSAENDIGGLDEAIEKFAYQKAVSSSMNRHGPILGIPDDIFELAQFEVAEDAANLSDTPVTISNSTNSQIQPDAPWFGNASISWRSKRFYLSESETSPLGENEEAVYQQGGHNKNTKRTNRRSEKQRRRATSLPAGSTVSPQPQSVPVYLLPSEILACLQRPFRRAQDRPINSSAVSFPDVREDSGNMLFRCWIPRYLARSQSLDRLAFEKKTSTLESKVQLPKRKAVVHHLDVDDVQRHRRLVEDLNLQNQPLLNRSGSKPQLVETENSSSPPSNTSNEGLNAVSPPPPRPQRRKKTKQSFSVLRLLQLGGACVALFAVCWALSVSAFLWGAAVGGFLTFCVIRIYRVTVDFLFSTSSSSPDSTCCFTSENAGAATCCSLHNSILSSWRPPYAGPLVLPQLRDLPAPPVPQLADEEIRSGSTGGPLGDSLGYKLDKLNRPIYKAWMNEIVFYTPETYHINNTHSVYLTLEGTQLRIQRPRKNVSRRAMFNQPVAQTAGVNFIHQRIFDMQTVLVSILPNGLVGKRIWSKKYPICLTIKNSRKATKRNLLRPDNATRGADDRAPGITQLASQPNLAGRFLSTASQSPAVDDHVEAAETGVHRSLSFGTSEHPQKLTSPYTASKSRNLRAATISPIEDPFDKASPSTSSPAATPPPGDFLLVRHTDTDEKIFLFARTCREKETWFRRLRGASIGQPLLTTTQQAFQRLLTPRPLLKTSTEPLRRSSSSSSSSSTTDLLNSSSVGTAGTVGSAASRREKRQQTSSSSPPQTPDEELQLSYLRHMAKFMPASWLLRASQVLQLNLNFVSCDSQVPWLNALIGRLFWDFLRHKYWAKRMQEKIQGKLRKIHLPYFVNELIVTSVEMGTELPVIRSAGKPFLDNQGLWIEVEVVYAGGFTVALETNVNLGKFRDKAVGSSRRHDLSKSLAPESMINGGGSFSNLTITEGIPSVNFNANSEGGSRKGIAAFVSDEEDSADSSTDSDRDSAFTAAFSNLVPLGSAQGSSAQEATPVDISRGLALATNEEQSELSRPKRGFHRLMDKITRSAYFQKAVDSKFVQRGIDYVSHKAINLQLEVSMLHGTLVLNLPPPPSDRLWYGFRGNPNLRFKLKPKFGETLVTIPRFLEIMEKKLILEFQRVLVLPNMDDIVMPLLIPEPILESSREDTKTVGSLEEEEEELLPFAVHEDGNKIAQPSNTSATLNPRNESASSLS